MQLSDIVVDSTSIRAMGRGGAAVAEPYGADSLIRTLQVWRNKGVEFIITIWILKKMYRINQQHFVSSKIIWCRPVGI